jgi:hypothetical protein
MFGMAKLFPATKAILAVFATAMTLSAFAQAPQPSNNLLQLTAAVRDAGKAASSLDSQIWNGFHFNQVPLVIWDGASRQILLAHVSPLPDGFVSAGASFPEAGIGSLPEGSLPTTGVAPFAGRLSAWIDADALAKAGPAQARWLLYQEAFRVYSQYLGIPPAPSLANGGYPENDAANNAMLRAEALLCQRLLLAPVGEAPSVAAALLALRAQRQARLPQEIVSYEWARENSDGLCDYAGYKAAEAIDKASAASSLNGLLSAASLAGQATSQARWGAAGCALALALDQSSPSWKTAFEKSSRASLEPVLRQAFGAAAPTDIAFLNLAALTQEEQKLVDEKQARNTALLDSITKAKGLVVVLDLSSALGFPGVTWTNRYEPKGLVRLDSERMIQSFYKLDGKGVLEYASSRPSLIKVRQSITAGFAPDEAFAVIVDGKPVTFSPESPTAQGEIEIRGPQYTLKVAKGRADWSASDRVLKITPMRPEA